MNKNFLKNPPNKYRPAPFWSWNEKLNVDETLWQIDEMEKAGIGGFFMHARGGLQTEYMSDEWFENIKASSERANETGLLAWGYDENGWPSGFGAGAVNGKGLSYQQKYLRGEITDSPKQTERTITNIKGENGKNYHMYFDVNPFYVDVLDKNVVAEFIKSTHEKYIEKLGTDMAGMTGFFTDEPQVSRNGCPWSFVIEKEYFDRYGEELTPVLHSLLFDIKGGEKVRYRFWKLVRDLFVESYNHQLHDWHKEHGFLYTGHMACEEKFTENIKSNGSAMPHYEFMDVPGMDHLNRELASIQTEMQLTSVANQLGKRKIMSETFALSGWNVSFEDLRWIYENQMVHGVTFLCQHLEGYSLRGIRKRDYPASLFVQQPWWEKYRAFNDMVSRIGMLLAEGDVDYKVLVLNGIESAWTKYLCDDETEDATDDYCEKLIKVMENLEHHQIQYHLGDDRIIERYGKSENGVFTVGTQNYKVVVVPPSNCLSSATLKLLKEFKANGGMVIFTEEIPTFVDGIPTEEIKDIAETSVVCETGELYKQIPTELIKISLEYKGEKDENPVLTAVRRFEEDKMTMYYLVNPNEVRHNLTITAKGKSAEIFDAKNGETASVGFKVKGEKLEISAPIYERGSLVLFVYDEEKASSVKEEKEELIPITDKLSPEWKIAECGLNSLTLDYLDLYFEGKEAAKNIHFGDAQEMACDFFKKVKTDMVFNFTVKEDDFEKCMLAVETPEIFDITVNGSLVDKKDLGYFHDKSFRLLDIRHLIKKGKNKVCLSVDFEQSETVYENIKKAKVFETEKNKLTYDMELEAIYLVGDFAVASETPFEELDNRGLRTKGGFYICNKPESLNAGNIVEQGYPFFAGNMTFEQKITLSENETQNRSFKLEKLSSTITEVWVNGKNAGQIMWQPYEIDISKFLKEGENTITVKVIGNLRNLLGPFHLKDGEVFEVGPYSFFHNSPIWSWGENKDWSDSYCFVEYGLFL